VIARSQGPQLVDAALNGMVGHRRRIRTFDATPLFYADEILMPPVAPFHTPPGPMGHHTTKVFPREPNEPTRSDASRHSSKEFGHEPFQARLYIRQRQICSNQPHAAVDVVPHPARRNDARSEEHTSELQSRGL